MTTFEQLRARIDAGWEELEAIPDAQMTQALRDDVEAVIHLLDEGKVRAADPIAEGWHVNEWVKKAILMYFGVRKLKELGSGPFEYRDKLPLKRGYERSGVRVVPPATARFGSFLAPGVVLMPCYVNVGAWVGSGTMVDTWATVGSCAQIGTNVHLAGGVGIGGVLEPLQASPVVIEDRAFIGSRCVVVEGVRVRRGAVLGAGVVLTASTPILDVTGPEPVDHRGVVPPDAVVIPGTRPRTFPAGDYALPCGLIIGYRNADTDDKVGLNELLREHGSSLG